MEERTIYSRYLPCDEELVVNIAIADGKIYHQRCILNSISNDLADMGFTGDEVPEWAMVDIGTALELRGRTDRGSFGCRAVVVDRNIAGHYLIRLVGSVYFGELREFQRIDVYLPLKYAVNRESDLGRLTDSWLTRKGEQKRAIKNSVTNNAWMDDTLSDNWDEIVPILAQSTPEGLRIDIPEAFSIGTCLDIEMYLPIEPPRVIAAVCEVVDSEEHSRQEDGTILHRAYLNFTLVDSPDRDAVNDFVSNVQVLHLGEICKDAQYQALYNRLAAQVEWKDPLLIFKRIIIGAIVASLCLLLFRYLYDYRQGHEKGMIEKAFEDSVRRYQEKFK
jgi:Family of unknown function (DUF5634) N-terminal domain